MSRGRLLSRRTSFITVCLRLWLWLERERHFVMSTQYRRNVIMITSFEDQGKNKSCYRICAQRARSLLFAYGSIQWKMTHKPNLCVKTSDNCNNSYCQLSSYGQQHSHQSSLRCLYISTGAVSYTHLRSPRDLSTSRMPSSA